MSITILPPTLKFLIPVELLIARPLHFSLDLLNRINKIPNTDFALRLCLFKENEIKYLMPDVSFSDSTNKFAFKSILLTRLKKKKKLGRENSSLFLCEIFQQ